MVRLPRKAGAILNRRDSSQGPVVKEVRPDFHFSEQPTVTTGFIGFYFDIREVLKVAAHREN
jgi:hypothetical protein